MSCNQHAVPIQDPSRPRSFKNVPSPAPQLPALPSAIASTQTSSTNGFECKCRKARRFNLHHPNAYSGKKFSSVASTSRDDYRVSGGTEPVGTDQDGDPHWLDVVRALYQSAWRSNRNELVSAKAKAKAMRAQHQFD